MATFRTLALLCVFVFTSLSHAQCCLGVASRAAATAPCYAAHPAEAYVEILNRGSVGSGAAVFHAGRVYILTAKHVVAGRKVVTIRRESEDGNLASEALASVALEDAEADLALLLPRAALPGLKPLRVAVKPALRAGQRVTAVSTSEGVHASPLTGEVTKSTYIFDDRDVLLATIPAGWFGASGSAVCVDTCCGPEVVGVISRLAAWSPRTPLVCENSAAIATLFSKVGAPKCKCGKCRCCGGCCK